MSKNPASAKLLPVLQVSTQDLTHLALVVGDQSRAENAASLLENPRLVGSNREYVTYRGTYAGQSVTVCSHGVGSAGASVCFTELLQAGVQVIIRAGTCGALQEKIDDGSLVLGLGAIREDGTSEQLIPLAYPAFADPVVIRTLQEAAAAYQIPLISGVILTQAHLYPGLQPSTIELWQKAGAVAVEMEYAALLVIASLHGARAGGIFVTDGNLARKQSALSPENYDPHRMVVKEGIRLMLRVALEALVMR